MQDHKDRPLALTGLLGSYPWSSELRQGIETRDYQLSFDPASEASTRFKAFIRDNAFDCGEMAIVTHLQALAYGRDQVLLPLVVLGNHHHKSIATRSDRSLKSPKDLAGKRVGVRTYAQTTGVWVRGFLQHDYGVDLDQVTWVTFDEAHLPEYQDPKNCVRAPKGANILDMLSDGSIDAAILGMNMPNDPRIVPVIPAPVEAATAWEKTTGLVPINHMFVVSRALCEARPEIVRDIYQRLSGKRGTADARFPVGRRADWSGLDLVARFAFEQNIVPRLFTAEELFEDSARLLKI